MSRRRGAGVVLIFVLGTLVVIVLWVLVVESLLACGLPPLVSMPCEPVELPPGTWGAIA